METQQLQPFNSRLDKIVSNIQSETIRLQPSTNVSDFFNLLLHSATAEGCSILFIPPRNKMIDKLCNGTWKKRRRKEVERNQNLLAMGP